MKRMFLLMMTMFLVGLILGSVALAQGFQASLEERVIHGTTMFLTAIEGVGGFTAIEGDGPPTIQMTAAPLVPSGGPSILLPGAALLLGTGVLTYSILRRRR